MIYNLYIGTYGEESDKNKYLNSSTCNKQQHCLLKAVLNRKHKKKFKTFKPLK